MVELRYVYDCENLTNSLEYRHMEDGQPVTRWMKVPSVYPKAGDYVDPSPLNVETFTIDFSDEK